MKFSVKWFLLATMLATSLAVVTGCERVDESQRVVGQLESDRIELIAEFSEPIDARPVAEGASVEAGTLLLQQNGERVSARIAELEAVLEQQRARLAELTRGPRQEQIVASQANVAGARKDLDFREIEYQRAVDVHDRKLASPESLDRTKAALDAARATLEFHEARLAELLAGTTVEELRQAEGAVRQAEARLAAGRIDLERHSIIAPVDGVVDSILFELGERPSTGAPTVVLLAGDQPYARVYVPESQRAHIRVGTSASVHVDGIEEPYEGRVRWIASEAAFTPYFALTEHDRGRLTYLAKIDLERRDVRLADGVPVEALFLSN